MLRMTAILVFLALAASTGFLGWRLHILTSRVAASETHCQEISTSTDVLLTRLKETSEHLEALKISIETDKALASKELRSSTVAQLSLAQSYRTDRIVDWIGLIEDKIFFILFPPTDPIEKERRAGALRVRTEDVRSQFQAVAMQEQILRNEISSRITEQSAGETDQSGE